jgi:uncharacterized protein (UPF0333 family)
MSLAVALLALAAVLSIAFAAYVFVRDVAGDDDLAEW